MIDAQGRVDTALQITQEHMERCECVSQADAAIALHALINAATYGLVIAVGQEMAKDVLHRTIQSVALMIPAQPGTMEA